MNPKISKGCLVIHGLTGKPANMNSVAEALKTQGYLVKAPVLAGHGGDFKTLCASTWPEWYASLREAYEALAKEAEEIYFVGLSMGALLGLKLAADLGNSLKAAAILAPPFVVRPIFRYFVLPSVRYTPLRFFIRSVAKNFEKSVLDPEGRAIYKANSFQRMPSACVFETQNLVWLLKTELQKIRQPLLLMQGRQDHLADPQGLLEIKKGVSSSKVDLVLLDRSAHVVTVDYEKETVAKRVIEFFERATSQQTVSASKGSAKK